MNAQRHGWERLAPAQQWLLENILSSEPAGEDERPVKQTQDTTWSLNLRAAQQYHTRERHLRVPREHVERLETGGAPAGRQEHADGAEMDKLGTRLDNTRKRADKLTGQRRADLDRLGMRW
ncbi:helicase associated domain-containing protein [Streptomyces sp. NPDC059832]|uniref:helicase associated domain-containing protein n=1 Tax=Streptomyces sp. NPDC059832 TaxID=3346966 RepID=UPI00365F8084